MLGGVTHGLVVAAEHFHEGEVGPPRRARDRETMAVQENVAGESGSDGTLALGKFG